MLKTFLHPGQFSSRIHVLLLFLRVSIGGLMLTHGIGKISKLFGDAPLKFADPLGLGTTTSLILVVFSEVLCSLLIIFGFASRLAAIPLIITMVVAALVIHADDPFSKKELPFLYILVYITILILGSGKYSLDHLIHRKLK